LSVIKSIKNGKRKGKKKKKDSEMSSSNRIRLQSPTEHTAVMPIFIVI